MESIAPACTKLKQRYEACFYKWYSERYLTGQSKEDECAGLFKEYRDCLESVLKEKNIDQMLIEHHKRTDSIKDSSNDSSPPST